jgi:hypothetical protein
MKTGRTALSDAAKKQAGTFDPRWSAEARAERAEQKVVALFGADRLNVIPEPPPGLSDEAANEFKLWTRRLHEQERLSQIWVEKITFYAMRKHKVMAKVAKGEMPSADDLKGCELFLRELNALNIDAPTAGSQPEASRGARTAALSRMIGKRPA